MALKAVAAPLGSPVGGSGTTNTIPRWTGASTLGDSGLIDDGTQVYTTTRKLAVGSASAVSELTAVTGAVAPTANPPALQTLHGNNQNVFRAKYTSTNFNVSGNWLGLGLGYHDNYMKAAIIAEAKDGTGRASMHIALNAATTAANVGLADARLTVTYDGNVGIGTASPVGYANFVALNIGDNNAAKTGLLKFRSTYNAGNGAELYQATDGRVILNADGTGTTAAILDPTNKLLNIAPASGWGLKLPATPGNADTQTLDCYAETTLNSGFTTSGITSTGTLTVTARATRIGRSIALTVKITPSGGASLTFASGWYVTLTGIPQMPDIAAFAAISNDAIGARGSIFCDAAATPTIYGGTAGAYALGANISLLVSGIVT